MDEYVEMLIAAGWIGAGDVDDEYQQYLKAGPQHDDDDDMSYEQWQSCRAQHDELNKEFKKLEVEHPAWADGISAYEMAEGKRLLRDMAWLEGCLRY